MESIKVTEGVYRIFANIYDENLFEGMWPIPHGVSMNAYLVKGEKIALIDGLGSWEGMPESLFDQLGKLDTAIEDIDYFIVNHLEPDHTGWLDDLLKKRKDAQVYTTKKGAALMKAFFGIEDNIHVVECDDTLSLGNGMELVFKTIPNVHWPETMATLEIKTGALFPCDAFGSYGAVTDKPFDDMLSEEDFIRYEREALRYYANIVASFSLFVEKAIQSFAGHTINIVAPSHGIIWRKDPLKIINDYKRYAGYAKGPAKPLITLIWSSMYGMTGMAVEPLLEAIRSEGVDVCVHQVPGSHVSDILASVWESTGVVVGMPTYEYKMFPPMATVLDDLGRKKMKGKKAFRFGSFGWSGGAQRELDDIMARMKMGWEWLEPVEFNGKPSDEQLDLIRQRGKELAREVKSAALES